MDTTQWQRIQDNLPQIIQAIKFTKTFMAYFEQHRVLAECDIETIDAKNTKSEKVYELLSTIKARSNSFAVLVFALRETLQHDVANILDPGGAYVPTPVVLPSPIVVNAPVVAQNLPPSVQLDYVVGNKGCEIHTILTVIKDNPVGHTFQNKWGDFAFRLEVPASERDKYKRMVNKGDAELIDVVEYCIEFWRNKNGENAKLSSLLKMIEKCDSKEIADAIRRKIGSGAVKLLLPDKTVTSNASSEKTSEATPDIQTKREPCTQPRVLASSLIVGSKECSIGKIVRTVEKNSVGHTFLSKLSGFGRILEIDPGKKETILNSSGDNSDKLEKILEQWKLDNGQTATLETLLEAIDEHESKEITESLLETFKCRR